MIKQFMLTGALAACVFTAACGGGGGSDGSSSGGTNGSSGGPTGNKVAVSGPLDTVQTTVSNSLLGPLEGATKGTPLAGLLVCTDFIVNQNTLDVLDSLLNGLQNPTTLSTTTPAQVQALLMEIANNLGGTLNSLAGKSGCGAASTGTGVPTSNPLAGTPLAPLGDALLPILQKIQSQTGGGSGSGNGIADLALLVDQLNAALQSGLAQIPASTFSQPVIGGALTTLKTTVADLAALTDAFAANSASGFETATQNLLNNLLVNVLTQVVPTSYIETQAGKPGTITGPIKQASATFSAQVAAALTQGEQALLAALNSSQLAPVVNPVLNQILPAILGPITQALSGVGGSSSGGSSSGGGLTGTPLDALLGPLTSILSGILGGTGSGSIPCVFANTPLSALCKLLP